MESKHLNLLPSPARLEMDRGGALAAYWDPTEQQWIRACLRCSGTICHPDGAQLPCPRCSTTDGWEPTAGHRMMQRGIERNHSISTLRSQKRPA